MRPKLIARWESRGGAHIVELWETPGTGYRYNATGAGGYLGSTTREGAIAELEARVGDFQPDRNVTPMHRVI